MKKNWKLQCLICKHSRKFTDHALITCTKRQSTDPTLPVLIYYGSDLFTGFITCYKFDPMQDPFKQRKE